MLNLCKYARMNFDGSDINPVLYELVLCSKNKQGKGARRGSLGKKMAMIHRGDGANRGKILKSGDLGSIPSNGAKILMRPLRSIRNDLLNRVSYREYSSNRRKKQVCRDLKSVTSLQQKIIEYCTRVVLPRN
ncbi:hypothetical protein PIB30_067520 [Stylosanthes scabra]|uniref:Uncharacterized protein n=1 Tax=Stylosanthes scabra TaxID=79078 RepID=A0ABU6XLJ5_9FABA|nr:hypothetical protein [Stylosanthes scabra]